MHDTFRLKSCHTCSMLKILLEAKMFLRSVIPQSLQDYLPGRGMRVDSLAVPWEEI